MNFNFSDPGSTQQLTAQQMADRAKIDADVDLQNKSELMRANANRTSMMTRNALTQGRRKAGGGAYRSRGTVLPSVGGLDKANMSALAEARRKAGYASLESREKREAAQASSAMAAAFAAANSRRPLGFHNGALFV